MLFQQLLTASALTAVASAHYHLVYPPNRGFVEMMEPQYPCGGFNTVDDGNRTQIPIGSAFPIQLSLEHVQTNIQVVLALGNAPGNGDFNTVLVPTFAEAGPMNFCVGGNTIPAHLHGNTTTITPGMNATIQVITDGDSGGGLYQCADITFVSQPLSTDTYNTNCQNSTNVKVTGYFAQGVNANTTVAGQSTSGSGTSGSGASPSASSGAAVAGRTVAGGAIALGLLALGMTA